jgi:hypothetical protein
MIDVVGLVLGVGGKVAYDQQTQKNNKNKAEDELVRAEKKADQMVQKAKDEADEIERERRRELKKVEDRLADREVNLDKKLDDLDKRSEKLRAAEDEVESLKGEIREIRTKQQEKLEKIAGLKKKDAVDLNIQNGNYVLIKKDAGHIVGRYRKVADDSSKFYTVIKHLNKNGVNELAELELPFDYPKPLSLVKDIVYGATRGRKDSVILDFFAGSGTTGQAVLELNKDGGNRQFILVTNNEVTDINPKGIAYDVTSRRLKRVMTGEDYDGDKNFKWLEKNKPYGDNLLVVDLAEVSNREAIEGKTAFDVIDETLYGQEKLDVNEKIKWVATNFERTQERLEEK